MKQIKCKYCGEIFTLLPNKPGKIDVCYLTDCQTQGRNDSPEPPKLGGNMIWSHKTAPEIEIKSLIAAQNFAKKTKRFGAGVTCSLTVSKESEFKSLTNTNPFGNGDANSYTGH